MRKQRVKFLMTVICMLAAGICYSCSGRTDQPEPDSYMMTAVLQTEEISGNVQKGLISAETEAQEDEPEDFGKESWEEPMTRQTESVHFYVHICGEVRNPGVYELEPGSRIFQAVELAGGLTEEAAGDYLNMALEIGDGMKITVPSQQEAAKEEAKEAAGTGDDSCRPDSSSFGQWIEMPGNSLVGAGEQDSVQADSGKAADLLRKINLNTASKEELMTLRGIGEAKAADIIRYREERGFFQTIEEIMNVSGIKEAAFEKIKDSITVQDKAP